VVGLSYHHMMRGGSFVDGSVRGHAKHARSFVVVIAVHVCASIQSLSFTKCDTGRVPHPE
jgi:hypothetical protein